VAPLWILTIWSLAGAAGFMVLGKIVVDGFWRMLLGDDS
jgi:hypothetical protein